MLVMLCMHLNPALLKIFPELRQNLFGDYTMGIAVTVVLLLLGILLMRKKVTYHIISILYYQYYQCQSRQVD